MQLQRTPSSSDENSNKAKDDLSLKPKTKIDRNVFPAGSLPPSGSSRASAYLKKTARAGSNAKRVEPARSGYSTTANVLSGETETRPETANLTRPSAAVNATCTFVNSVISLCNKPNASCGEIGNPGPPEDMFLLLVRSCGLTEAKLWSKLMGFPHERSAALLENLKAALS
jgi:hypothetical protein